MDGNTSSRKTRKLVTKPTSRKGVKIKFSIQSKDLQKFAKDFSKSLRKRIKPTVIKRGLDKPLKIDVENLKAELFKQINQRKSLDVPVQSEAEASAQQIEVSKSDEQLIKHITGIDLKKFSVTKDFSSLVEQKIALMLDRKTQRHNIIPVPGQVPTSSRSSGINLRIPMNTLDSFDSQHSSALTYFNEAMFVFVDNFGNANYYVNPGIDLSQYVKIVCSKKTGDTQESRERFNELESLYGHADWSLKKEAINVIKKDFVNLTPIIEKIKKAEHEEAIQDLQGVKALRLENNKTAELVQDKVNQLKEEKDLAPDTKAYNDIIGYIKNLRITKKISKEKTTYFLVTTTSENIEEDFLDVIEDSIRIWKITNEEKWVQDLVIAILKLIKHLIGN